MRALGDSVLSRGIHDNLSRYNPSYVFELLKRQGFETMLGWAA